MVILGSLGFGSLGYWLIEGDWTYLDCIYMAIIAVTTVGFREVHPLSDEGRAFTVIYLFLNMAVTIYAATTMTSYILEGHLGGAIRRRRLEKQLSMLQNHVIICGFGRVGRAAAEQLQFSRSGLVIVDHDEDTVGKARALGYPAVQGLATDEDVLQRAGVGRARGVMGALGTDNDNITLCLVVRDMNPDVTLVCRSTTDTSVRLLKRAGATHVISPYEIGGARMATMLVHPEVLQFLDVTMHTGDAEVHLESVEVAARGPLDGKVLRETRCFAESGTIVIGMVDREANVTVNPPRDALLEAGMTLIVLGDADQQEELRQILGKG
jgi:voltage-gated potassium channel